MAALRISGLRVRSGASSPDRQDGRSAQHAHQQDGEAQDGQLLAPVLGGMAASARLAAGVGVAAAATVVVSVSPLFARFCSAVVVEAVSCS